jgi:hypothetical protein
MKNLIIVYESLENIDSLLKVSDETGANVFLTKSLDDGIQFEKKNKTDLFVIDNSFSIFDKNIELLQNSLNLMKLFLIETKEEKLQKFSVSRNKLIEIIQKETKKVEKVELPDSERKNPVIFYEAEKFKETIKAETRRAKRYRYHLSVVLFQNNSKEKISDLMKFFSDKIREFDYLWVISEDKFAMVLPHTAWNGAQILSNRLVKDSSEKFGFALDSLKNSIIAFKRIENDESFMAQIEKSIKGEFHEIDRKIDFYVWKDELFNEFLEAKTIRIFNRYKGMLVSHDADMVYRDCKLNLHNIRAIQQNIIDIEKFTYFYSNSINKTIRAGIQYLDKENRHAILSSYEIVEPIFTKTTIAKLSIEENIDVFLRFDNDEVLSTKLYELSLDELTVYSESVKNLQENQAITVNFEIQIRDKTYKIESSSRVLQVEVGENISYFSLNLQTSLKDNMKISEFLSIKQISFIKELKS